MERTPSQNWFLMLILVTLHTHQESIKNFITYIISSGESRAVVPSKSEMAQEKQERSV